ncbi:GNAT family N-acetyltransferase [Pseudonocardia acaciae]|uniref:GNAT family N-acetyltransferase n=1 Tax=Pseudonocardia acaciae TaxID=551276 RepID=UPI00146FD365|nr:GNAT family N-acetyltransferase [Pseudonocardia acaciae]
MAVADELAALYARVFAEPPYREGPADVRVFVRNYTEDVAHPGFGVVVAHDDGTAVGFGYGTARRPGEWWPGCDAPPPPEIVECPSFAVYEWAVDKPYRGRGVGREIMVRLLADRPEPWATLAVHPHADAYRIYIRAGWRQVGMSYIADRPAMAVLIRRTS